jgi:phosphoesterase RecJ-like protein
VVLKQVGDRRWTANMRSKGRLDVAAAASALGGGGHRHASGFTVDGDAPDILDRVRRALADAPLLG